MGILEDILMRLERIEAAVGTGAQPAQTPAPAPAPAPPQGLRVSESVMQQAFPTPPQGSLYGDTPGGAAPGPQPVPTIEELNALLLDLQQQQGTDLCVSLMRQHHGQSQDGSVSLSNVPVERYAALQQAIRQQLGVH